MAVPVCEELSVFVEFEAFLDPSSSKKREHLLVIVVPPLEGLGIHDAQSLLLK